MSLFQNWFYENACIGLLLQLNREQRSQRSSCIMSPWFHRWQFSQGPQSPWPQAWWHGECMWGLNTQHRGSQGPLPHILPGGAEDQQKQQQGRNTPATNREYGWENVKNIKYSYQGLHLVGFGTSSVWLVETVEMVRLLYSGWGADVRPVRLVCVEIWVLNLGKPSLYLIRGWIFS